MKYSAIIAVTAFLVASSLLAQTPDIIWETSFDNNGNRDMAWGVTSDSQGNIIVVGTTRDSTYYNEFLIVKFDSSGTYIWHKTWDSGAPSGCGANAVACDNYDNIIAVGPDALVESDYNTVKFDPDGNEIWARYYDSGGDDVPEYVATDAANCIYSHGSRDVATVPDWYTVKYDSAGSLLFGIPWDGGDDDRGHGVATYKDSLFATTGYSYNPSSSWDFVVNLYDASGNFIRTRIFDNGSDDNCRVPRFDSKCNLIVHGSSYLGGQDDFLTIQYDKFGSIRWLKTYDSGLHDEGVDMNCDLFDNIVVTGWNGDNPNRDWLTVKYDSIGDFVWAAEYDISGTDDISHGVTFDNNGNPIVAGSRNYATFGSDIYLVKYSATPTGIEEDEVVEIPQKNFITIEPNPFIKTAILKSNQDKEITIYDASGRMIMKQNPGLFGENLKQGIYFLKLTGSDPVKVIKLR